MYATILSGAISEYPVDLSSRLPNTSFPENWLSLCGAIDDVEYVLVHEAPQPDYDPATQNIVEGIPALVAGIWTQQWSVTDASATEIAERLEAKRANMTCTPRQARLALAYAGLLTSVEAWVEAQGPATKIEWEYASEVRRADGLVASAAEGMGMTETQIDDLFDYAVTL